MPAKGEKAVAKKAGVKKVAAKKRVAKKRTTKKVAKKAVAKKTVAKKPAAKRKPAKRKTKAKAKTAGTKATKAKRGRTVKAKAAKKATAKKPKAKKAKATKRKATKKKAKAKVKGKVKSKTKTARVAKAKKNKATKAVKRSARRVSSRAESESSSSSTEENVVPRKLGSKKSAKFQSNINDIIGEPFNVDTTQIKRPRRLDTPGILPYQEQPGEEYMNASQREHFRQILNQRRQELMEKVDRTKYHMQGEAGDLPDPNDRASREEEFGLELRERDRERKLIKKIEEALQKLDNNEYGYCEACGVEIGIRRLEARPTANLCIDCKTLDEIKEKQTTV